MTYSSDDSKSSDEYMKNIYSYFNASTGFALAE